MSDEQSDEQAQQSGDEQAQQSDDEQAQQSDDEQSARSEPDSERLEQLDESIDSARKTAEDADVLVDPDEPRYVDSGETEDVDDQTITPPA